MSEEKERRLGRGDRLPAATLPDAAGGRPVSVRGHGRELTILVALHGGDCPACREYVEQLVRLRDDILDWGGRVLLVADEAPSPLLAPGAGFQLLIDPGGEWRALAGIGTPAVLVADQWGEIFVAEEAGDAHAFLAPDEVVSWLRYLAIQCAECQGEAL